MQPEAKDEKLTDYAAGSFFEVPGNSSFTSEVETAITGYVCSFK